MPPQKRPPITRATDIYGIPNAFRPDPLSADEMEFYADSLDKRRHNFLQRGVKNDLLETAAQSFFFKGVLYGNRGNGKSTEINRLLTDPQVNQKFVVVRLDALNQLNPRTFGVADVLILLGISLIVRCKEKCTELGKAFHVAGIMEADLAKELAPFFPELQNKLQEGTLTGGSLELSLKILKIGLRREDQQKIDFAAERQNIENLQNFLERKIRIVMDHLPGYELLIVGENFDKEQIPQALLAETFLQYSPLFRGLPLHLLFTLPIPFVHSNDVNLPFDRDRQYPIYDIPICDEANKPFKEGIQALVALLEKRANLDAIFDQQALDLLFQASSGDLQLLFTMIVFAGKEARYRHEDDSATPAKILHQDVNKAVLRELSAFRSRMLEGVFVDCDHVL